MNCRTRSRNAFIAPGELGDGAGQAVGLLGGIALEGAEEFLLMVADDAEGSAVVHHVGDQFQHAVGGRPPVHQVADEDGNAASRVMGAHAIG